MAWFSVLELFNLWKKRPKGHCISCQLADQAVRMSNPPKMYCCYRKEYTLTTDTCPLYKGQE